MGGIQRDVADAYPDDYGKGIARLDPETLTELNVSQGEVIVIEGTDRTPSRVRQLDRQDWFVNIVRIDECTRNNAGVDTLDSVAIRTATSSRAKKIVVTSTHDEHRQFWDGADGIIRKLMIDRVVASGDLVPIRNLLHTEATIYPNAENPQLQVVSTEPEGFVEVARDTKVTLYE